MSSERLWIALLALVSLLTGMAGGVLAALALRRPAPAPGPFDAYEAAMTSTFDLDEEHAGLLRRALASYDEEVEALQARQLAELEPELIELGRTCRDRIRRFVVPEERRDEFDRLAAGYPAVPSSPR